MPLSRGIVDRFSSAGLPILGPTRAAAALESSKTFAKAFMARHGVPTAAYHVCDSAEEAVAFLTSGRFGYPVVLKADGLAAGKGVVVAPDAATAHAAVTAMMRERRFGDAGDRVVIEECLEGPELSYFVLSDGERVVPLGSAQDHKRVFDGDAGPNTGGMGAFAPSPLLRCRARAPHPRRDCRARHRRHARRGPPVSRLPLLRPDAHALGPEGDRVQRALRRSRSAGGAAADRGQSDRRRSRLPPPATCAVTRVRLASACTVGVVLASGGYPDAFETGKLIEGLDEAASLPDVTLFHAGTALRTMGSSSRPAGA